MWTGRHLVDIYCKGQRVAGSPYAVEVFDPKKVGLESMAKETYLHEQTEFEGMLLIRDVPTITCLKQVWSKIIALSENGQFLQCGPWSKVFDMFCKATKQTKVNSTTYHKNDISH